MIYHLGDSILRRVLSDVYKIPCFRTGNGRLTCQLCVGGQSCSQIKRRVLVSRKQGSPWHVNLKHSTIVIMTGTEDAFSGYRKTAFRRNCEWLVRELRRMKVAKIIMCTIPPLLKNYRANETTILINESILYLAKKIGIHVADVRAEFDRATDNLFESDGIHPNSRGLQLIAAVIKEETG